MSSTYRRLHRRRSPVYGLVLAGGESSRMGCDKGALEYEPGVSAVRRTAEIAGAVCERVFVSTRAGQGVPADAAHLPVVEDRHAGFGPLAGISAALEAYRDVAWLVLSCDLPLLAPEDVLSLVDARSGGGIITCLAPDGVRPEPLCAVWEGAVLPFVQAAIARGERAPVKILDRVSVALVTTANGNAAYNANTGADLAAVGIRGCE